MCQFVKQEAEEKANEIKISAEEVRLLQGALFCAKGLLVSIFVSVQHDVTHALSQPVPFNSTDMYHTISNPQPPGRGAI